MKVQLLLLRKPKYVSTQNQMLWYETVAFPEFYYVFHIRHQDDGYSSKSEIYCEITSTKIRKAGLIKEKDVLNFYRMKQLTSYSCFINGLKR